MSLTDRMSGDVRFTERSGHRIPHDPLLGLDRSITLLEHVIDNAMPFSQEETAAYFSMGKALSRRGSFKESLLYFKQAVARTQNLDQKVEALREAGTSHYRLGEYNDAGRMFFEGL